jgi:CO/xanthine dehydrogenase Mo-binding subunit
MASYADAFGYTPAEFMQLTLPQLNAYAKYVEKRDEQMKSDSKPTPAKNKAKFAESKSGMKTIQSLDHLAQVFGKPGA